jgi:hypothetical protein
VGGGGGGGFAARVAGGGRTRASSGLSDGCRKQAAEQQQKQEEKRSTVWTITVHWRLAGGGGRRGRAPGAVSHEARRHRPPPQGRPVGERCVGITWEGGCAKNKSQVIKFRKLKTSRRVTPVAPIGSVLSLPSKAAPARPLQSHYSTRPYRPPRRTVRSSPAPHPRSGCAASSRLDATPGPISHTALYRQRMNGQRTR